LGFLLDFVAKAGIAHDMHEINKEKVREIFAVVTGRLEDASLLAGD